MSFEESPWEREDREIYEAFHKKDAEIERLKKELAHQTDMASQADVACLGLKSLCALAADALEAARGFDFISREVLDANGITNDLIAQLKDAAKREAAK